MPPNYFLNAWNRNFEKFKTLSPEELLARWKTTFKMMPTGGGEMKPFKEEVLVTPDGKVVEGEPATEQAVKYSLEHPKSDASENFLNDLMFGGFGVGHAFVNGAALSTIKGILNILPRLSFSNTYITGVGLSKTPTLGAIYADAGLAALTTAPSVYDISKNGLNWTNGIETTLGMLPVFGNMFRKPIKFVGSTSKIPNDLQINVSYSTNGTYAPYSSNNINIVNPDGSINREYLISAIRQIRRDHPNFISGLKISYPSSNGSTTLQKHLSDVVTSALSVPIPRGSSRANLVRGALVHDIGKILDANGNVGIRINTSRHGEKYRRFIDEIIPEKYRLEFSNPILKLGVELHMLDDGKFPVFLDHSDLSNYTLALRAADVGRGMSANEIGLNYPHLLLYDKASPSPRIFRGTPEEDLYAANLWLRANGYKTIGKDDDPIEYLTKVLTRHRSFYRGVRDPLKDGSDMPRYKRNALGAIEVLNDAGLSNTPENRLQVAVENVSLYPTGYGRASLFEVHGSDDVLPTHEPTTFSKTMGIDPNKKDALYVSVSPNILRTYSEVDRANLPARINLPFIPYEKGESLMEFIHKNDFTVINPANFKHTPFKVNSTSKIGRVYPMSLFRMIDIPYLELTGRPFSTDYTKWAKSNGRMVFDDVSPVEKVPYQLYDDKIKRMLDLIINLTGDKKLAESIRIIDEDGMMYVPTKIDLYIARLRASSGELTTKQKLYIKSLQKLIYTLEDKLAWSHDYKDPFELEDIINKDPKIQSLKEKINLLKIYPVKKILKEYKDDMYFYKNNKPKYRPMADLRLSTKLEFLLESGVLPVWMYNDFNKTIGFGSHDGYGIGFGRGSRNKLAPHSGSPLLFFVGNKGEKLLNINKKYTPEELRKLLDGTKENKGRDSGMIYFYEDPDYEVSRKTFKMGGKLNAK